MNTEQITIRVDADAAQAFLSASDEERRKLEALLSLRLIEATKAQDSLEALMSDISSRAQARGLTPEVLESILLVPITD